MSIKLVKHYLIATKKILIHSKINRTIRVNFLKKNRQFFLIFFTILFLCLLSLPIDSASIATGVIVLDYNRHTVSHLEGGIVKELLVKEGDEVNKDQILLSLEDNKLQNDLNIIQENIASNIIKKQRLINQLNNLNDLKIDIDDYLNDLNFQLQNNLKNNIYNNKQVLIANNKIYQNQLTILKYQHNLAKNNYRISQDEFAKISILFSADNIDLFKYNQSQQKMLQSLQDLRVARLDIINFQMQNHQKTFDQINEIDNEIFKLKANFDSLQTVKKRFKIYSPIDGKIINLKFHSIGMVVNQGQEILSIIPNEQQLVIHAKIKPDDIDNIALEAKTKIRLTALNNKNITFIYGKISNISADIFINPQTQESYYLATISIDQNDLLKLKKNSQLYLGMLTEVFVINDSRSIISYLLSPIYKSMIKSFKEQ